MDDENIKNEEIREEENEDIVSEQKTYDVAGLFIGSLCGILIAVTGITNILMGITVGMFLGLVIGSYVKKKG